MSNDTIHPTAGNRVNASDETQRAFDEGGRAGSFHGSLYDTLQIARVIGLVDDPKAPGKWSGRVVVQILGMDGSRDNVVVSLPFCGQAGFMGGIPDMETLLVIGWLPGGHPVALGQVPLVLRALESRKGLPQLKPGEVYIQSSVRSPDVDRQVAGGSVYLDAEGRLVAKAMNGRAEVVLGAGAAEPSTAVSVRVRSEDGQDMMRLTIDDAGSIVVTAKTVVLDAESVSVGEGTTPLNDLVTREWVNSVFAAHIHPTPAGMSSKPEAYANDGFTDKLRSL